jgi:hypothetical protein
MHNWENIDEINQLATWGKRYSKQQRNDQQRLVVAYN